METTLPDPPRHDAPFASDRGDDDNNDETNREHAEAEDVEARRTPPPRDDDDDSKDDVFERMVRDAMEDFVGVRGVVAGGPSSHVANWGMSWDELVDRVREDVAAGGGGRRIARAGEGSGSNGCNVPPPGAFPNGGSSVHGGNDDEGRVDGVVVAGLETGGRARLFPNPRVVGWRDKARSAYDAQSHMENGDPSDPSVGPWESGGGGSDYGCAATKKWIVLGSILLLTGLCAGAIVTLTLPIYQQIENDDPSQWPLVNPDGEVGGSGSSKPTSDLDLSMYGYPFARHTTSKGWISWPRVLNDENFASFNADKGVTSAEGCAATCRAAQAPAGAWDVAYEACWCTFLPAAELCREPCVEEEYVDFSERPISSMEYCNGSVCHDDWFHSDSYCDKRVDFDEEACDAEIATLRQRPNENVDLREYGYPYMQRRNSVSWPRDAYDQNFSFRADDGVTTLERCAAICGEANAPTGAWDNESQKCWCTMLNSDKLCKEPCVEMDHVDFSKVPFDEFQYCERSACDEDWFRDDPYCEDRFWREGCDTSIESLKLQAMAASIGETDNTGPKSKSPTVGSSFKGSLSIQSNLAKYGYPHVRVVESSNWWLSLPRDFQNENFAKFDKGDGVASAEGCAAKCRGANATAGAYDPEDGDCWCASFLDTGQLCMEPCVEKGYVDFSNVPLTKFESCGSSLCEDYWEKEETCVIRGDEYFEGACRVKIEALASASAGMSAKPEGTAQEIVSRYGYSYVQHTGTVGWVSWTPHVHDGNFFMFDSADGVASLEECAAKCQGLRKSPTRAGAPLGAWDVRQEACFCSFVDAKHLCKEPCVEEEYVDFSILPFEDFVYCTRSVCDNDWYHNEEYCVDQVGFDKAVCDAKIKALANNASSSPAVISPTGSVTRKSARIEPSATATTKFASPDAKNEGLINFSIQNGEERVSYVRFDLSSIAVNVVVESATLHLYLVRSLSDSDEGDFFQVTVLELQQSEEWSTGSVSHNIPPESEGESFVASFEVVPLNNSIEKKTYGVDVTSAIEKLQQDVTFKLSTESDVRIDFAGVEWNNGEAMPWLEVVFSELTDEPTAAPTKEPSAMPTKSSMGAITPKPMESVGTSATAQKHTESVIAEIDIEPSAIATTKLSSPDAKNEGLIHFSVENGNERTSFLRFDLSSILENDVIQIATLHLYLVRSVSDSDEEENFDVSIHVLPQVEEWSTGSVSYNEPLDSTDECFVESFEVGLLDDSTEKQMYTVDVTSAINNSNRDITFKLSTESDVRIDFAGKNWNGGEALPWLRVTYSELTNDHPVN